MRGVHPRRALDLRRRIRHEAEGAPPPPGPVCRRLRTPAPSPIHPSSPHPPLLPRSRAPQEISDSNINRDYESGCVISQVALSTSGRMLFAATEHGTIRSYKFPLVNEYYEIQVHTLCGGSNRGSGAVAPSHSSHLPPSLLQVDQTMHDLLKDLSHLANTKHIRVTRKAKQIAGSYQNNIAEQNKMVVLPALRQLSSAALSEEKEAEIVSSLLVELTLAQAKVLAMLGSSDKALRKAVAKAAVLLWYAHFDPTHFLFPHSY